MMLFVDALNSNLILLIPFASYDFSIFDYFKFQSDSINTVRFL